MQAEEKSMLERRQSSPEQSVWWNKLSLAQKFSASSLGKFGYDLAFVRNEEGHSLAVLTCSSGVAVITEDGDINTSPNIKIRD
ncbi:hypothetical protein L3081_07570 [Colwellia sp. MSW7]|jgi:hypothetical protein|uniref:Uncharacterized protein n=1 Tax=Colwellia maritima TaxID=2912588 RepID=A0ABS9X0J8_9GAMM|nr:hypothetical protein [Colwellia maritima]MCI2283287.1 hypothetical protein [Colwellia maritima]